MNKPGNYYSIFYTFLILLAVGCDRKKIQNPTCIEQSVSELSEQQATPEHRTYNITGYEPDDSEKELYSFLTEEIEELANSEDIVLSECRCISSFRRDLGHIDLSSRFQLDRLATEYMEKTHDKNQTLNLIFCGS